MSRRFFESAPLGRKPPARRAPKPTIVVVCEGKVTEPRYFNAFKDLNGNGLVAVKPIGGCGVPVSVVERAIEEKAELVQKARKSRDSFDAYFEVWAVFDRDAHPAGQVPRAFEMARQSGIRVAFSNPCFELWGLMHYGCYSRPGHHHETQDALKAAMSTYCHRRNPVFDMAVLDKLYDDAVKNAKRALEARDAEQDSHGDPSTTVFELTEQIRLYGRPTGRAPRSLSDLGRR